MAIGSYRGSNAGPVNLLNSFTDQWDTFRDQSLAIADTSCVALPTSQLCKSQCLTQIGCHAIDYTVSTLQCCLKQFAWGQNGFYNALLSTPGTDHFSQHCLAGNTHQKTLILLQWLMLFQIISWCILLCIQPTESTCYTRPLMIILLQYVKRKSHVAHALNCIPISQQSSIGMHACVSM